MPNEEAISRYSTAKGYLQATKMVLLSEHHKDWNIVACLLPTHMLIGFALELYFKAWLLHSGVPSADVRKFGHKIGTMYAEIQKYGFQDDIGLGSIVAIMAVPHGEQGDFTFRYIDSKNDSIVSLNWPQDLKTLTELDNKVDTYIGASVSRGLQPGH